MGELERASELDLRGFWVCTSDYYQCAGVGYLFIFLCFTVYDLTVKAMTNNVLAHGIALGDVFASLNQDAFSFTWGDHVLCVHGVIWCKFALLAIGDGIRNPFSFPCLITIVWIAGCRFSQIEVLHFKPEIYT